MTCAAFAFTNSLNASQEPSAISSHPWASRPLCYAPVLTSAFSGPASRCSRLPNHFLPTTKSGLKILTQVRQISKFKDSRRLLTIAGIGHSPLHVRDGQRDD